MAITIFDTPVLSTIMRLGSLLTLRLLGWKLSGKLPAADRFVMIAHPHTASVDLTLMLAVAFAFHLKLHWIGKQSLFAGWRGPFMK
ncbi:MAG: hypothetical protein HOE62_01725 [Alphaproteobacteria bacterium]|nr:hypothetical protein [Alphaproteobacteria bacterium]MBT4016637.1 hypothetical protein [Alphaproteobacteria bacterium]MBT4966892.1 hypothetical protein [Alphaproteobacteria bacterium]MBT5161102.1 hypothetical protein [Alphaproteobacteria bacterium]